MILWPLRLVWWLARRMARRLAWAVGGLLLRGVLGGTAGGVALRGLAVRGLWWRSFRLLLAAGLLAWLWAGMAAAQDWRRDPFDSGRLEEQDIRLVQAALALAGDYEGPIDGRWGRESAAALAAHAGRAPVFADLAPLLRALEEERRAGGWEALAPRGSGIAWLFPLALLELREEGEVLVFAGEGLEVRVSFGWRAATTALHRAALPGLGGAVQDLGEARMLTRGTLPSGEGLLMRSDLAAGSFHTVQVRAAPAQAGRLALIAGSIGPAPGRDLLPVPGGRVAALLGDLAPRGDEGKGKSAVLPPGPSGSGTAFFVTGTELVTAAHVVEGCGRMALADGTPLRVLRADDDLDLAVLSSPRQGEGFLALRPDARARLGAPVMALGYPYQGLIEQGLTVTGGNVSALPGVRQPKLMISAPVQPGNSGGPLIDAGGAVIGVVVSRLDDMAVYEATGSLPQNMNFAVPVAELARFLDRARVVWPGAGSVTHDLSGGVPDEIVAAVVPVYCYD